MSDINEALRKTVTAREEPPPLAAGHKRGRSDSNSNSNSASRPQRDAMPGTLKPAVGLDMEALQQDFAAERAREGAHIRNSLRVATQLSEEAASRMAFRLLEYVMKDQLGGKHNAVASASLDGEMTSSLTLDVALERATLRAVAALDVSYVCSGSPGGDTPCVGIRKESAAASPVVTFRKLLRPCRMATDLVGGVTAGLAPHSRLHWQRTIEAALRGETEETSIDGTSVASTPRLSTHAEEDPPPPMPMDLFATSHGDPHGNAGGERDGTSGGKKPLFSVADFLNDAGSSSDADDNAER